MTRRTFDAFFLSAVAVAGAGLRLPGLGVPSFWLDEILGYDLATAAAKQPLWRWVTFFDPEHGPLYYATELAARFIHPAELSARIGPAIFGIAVILVAWYAARAIDSHPATPYVASILVAASPIEVYYSREARPYALALLLTTALLAALLRGRRLVLIVVLLVLALYATAAMAPVVMAVSIAAAAAAIGGDRRFWLAVTAAAAICVATMALVYRPATGVSGGAFPGIPSLLTSFSFAALDTTRGHRAAFIFLALAVIGAIDLAARRRMQATILIALTLFPALIGIVAIRAMHHFYSVRYVIGTVPGYLLLVSVGVAAIARFVPQRMATPAAVGIAALLAAQGWEAATSEPYRKLDWRTIARTIAAHAHANDPVIAANDWTAVCLRFYLRGLSPPVRLLNARGSRMMGEVFAYSSTTAWIVSANSYGEFAAWSCRFPVLLASPIESFRLQYSPTLYYFLTDRSTAGEQRAALASFGRAGPVLHFGPGEDAFFDPGWGGAEPEEGRWARWAIGTEARVALPVWPAADRTLTLELTPVSYPHAPPQRMTIRINDQPLTTLTLRDGRAHYTVGAPGTFWNRAVNILTFSFDHATPPASIDPRSSDHRPLAARFYELSLAGPRAVTPDEHRIRLTEDGPFLEGTDGGRALPPEIDAERLTRFVGLLGFDPQRALADLLDERLTLADLAAASLADNSVCDDDARFLASSFRALLGREITPRERLSLAARLQHGEPRAKMVRDLVNGDLGVGRWALGARR